MFQNSGEFLGHRVDKEGLHPMKEKVDTIQNVTSLKNITELKSFWGVLNHYAKLIPNIITM